MSVKNKIGLTMKTTMLLTGCLVCFLCMGSGLVQAAASFSFLVVGDTRTEPFLPGGQEQKVKILQVLQERFQSSSKDTELTFDALGEELVSVKIVESGYIRTMKYKNGWPQLIVLTDQEGQKNRVVMRSSGRNWVNDRIIAEMRKGAANIENGASFIVHGGDIPLFGFQGKSLANNPYYQLFDTELLMRLPIKPNVPALPGNLFSAVGNHASWGDSEIIGFRSTSPWLKQFGFSAKNRIYTFVHNNCSFIFLDSGGWSPEGTAWSSNYPKFKEQMAYLTDQLEVAKANRRDHVFVVYHKPSFNQIGHDPLPEDQNPHEYLKKYAKELSIFVFNSHVHTTERYLVDGINYQVMGGGGAPQKFTNSKNPSPQKELYWQDGHRFEEYNYLKIEVDGSRINGTIYRFRPLETLKPFTTEVVFQK
ncbi:MAG: hypothetical protein GAS50_08455 [Desulfobacterales bacterium]|nr:hypothetical protein [Desulfobacterales bacterium]